MFIANLDIEYYPWLRSQNCCQTLLMEPAGSNCSDVLVYTKKAVYLLTLACLHSHPSPFARQAWLAPHAIMVHCTCTKQTCGLLIVVASLSKSRSCQTASSVIQKSMYVYIYPSMYVSYIIP